MEIKASLIFKLGGQYFDINAKALKLNFVMLWKLKFWPLRGNHLFSKIARQADHVTSLNQSNSTTLRKVSYVPSLGCMHQKQGGKQGVLNGKSAHSLNSNPFLFPSS